MVFETDPNEDFVDPATVPENQAIREVVEHIVRPSRNRPVDIPPTVEPDVEES